MICIALAMPCACTSRLVRSFRSISISVSLRCSSCVAASLRDTASATSSGYCTLPTTTLVMTKRAAVRVAADAREHGVADRDQRVLDLEAVAALHLVAREGPQRLAHEVAVGDLHDRVGLLLVLAALTRSC